MEQESDVLVIDPNIWAKITETEQKSYLHELLNRENLQPEWRTEHL